MYILMPWLLWGRWHFKDCVANTSVTATCSSFLSYFRSRDNGKINQILLTKWIMHIYAYLWGSNPIKHAVSLGSYFKYVTTTKKSCISPNYATFISTETKHSRRYPAEKWHLANLIMSVVVYYKTSSVTLLDNELVISSITTPEWSL